MNIKYQLKVCGYKTSVQGLWIKKSICLRSLDIKHLLKVKGYKTNVKGMWIKTAVKSMWI